MTPQPLADYIAQHYQSTPAAFARHMEKSPQCVNRWKKKHVVINGTLCIERVYYQNPEKHVRERRKDWIRLNTSIYQPCHTLPTPPSSDELVRLLARPGNTGG